jgi:hypothetical protein
VGTNPNRSLHIAGNDSCGYREIHYDGAATGDGHAIPVGFIARLHVINAGPSGEPGLYIELADGRAELGGQLQLHYNGAGGEHDSSGRYYCHLGWGMSLNFARRVPT